jgi:hypothetical protein
MIPSKQILSTIRLEYFPSLEYFWQMSQCNIAILTDHFTYSKRTIMPTSAAISEKNVTLRVPVSHDKEVNPIYKKTISRLSDWPRDHILTLKHQYKNLPYRYLYFSIIEQLLNSKETNLSQFLTTHIKQIADWLNLDLKIYRASDIGFQYENNKSVIEWCNLFKCKTYINSSYIFNQNYVNKKQLEVESIMVCECSKIPDVNIFQYYKDKSILSFIFQFGPEAGYLINQFMTKP